MPLTPEEIQNKDFLISLRGYDKDEVESFLSRVADEFRDALRGGGEGGSADPFQDLGQEVGSVLQAAKSSADALRSKAEQEATAVLQKAREEAANLRESVSKAAARVKEDAERHAVQQRSEAERYAEETRSAAEREANERLRESARRVQRLLSTENNVRERLLALETMLGTLREDLSEGTEAGRAEAATLRAAEAPPAPDQATDEDLAFADADDEPVAGEGN
ncbi:MAG TPA: DivIVA domain-containing protein [Actinomycetota bacterium]|nr:DivIVA domain-containing protein [Actinomycetota bacterium]